MVLSVTNQPSSQHQPLYSINIKKKKNKSISLDMKELKLDSANLPDGEEELMGVVPDAFLT